jgi:hypothetical protein
VEHAGAYGAEGFPSERPIASQLPLPHTADPLHPHRSDRTQRPRRAHRLAVRYRKPLKQHALRPAPLTELSGAGRPIVHDECALALPLNPADPAAVPAPICYA